MPKNKDHNPEWKVEEQEILDQLYKGWLQYWNHESVNDAVNGMAGARRFYDFDQMLSYDMFGNTPRGHFGEHFDAIFPYWGDGQMDFKDIEITCLSKDSAFSTMIQHTWGTAGGTPFDTTFRRTGIAKKRNGKWKWIHEHLSYPADMKTGKADFTCGLDPTKAFKLQ
ncbi:hypothetical protein BGZ57DRAFT_945013 [Hyaloscypha finlandica]|nr:hypothetical protein BGZ57DRAFT_945013 [Hyaloscypha finlandica]KAH8794248.1 hypothetical protein F5882DRAFT_426836 [Hyaloscypha sp. PMI_1271]